MSRPMLFGKYCLLERLSVGGMAEVFRAKPLNTPTPTHRFLALKRILPHLAEDDEFIKMFVDEAKLCVHLRHPNIVHIFELGKFQSSSYILMEYIPGRDLLALQKRLRKRRLIMSVAQACYIVMELAKGLDYAHRATDDYGRPLNIIHRDVSPQNVIVSFNGAVKLIDFGVAKAAVQSTKTQVGVLKGKFGYMSPEQIRGEQIDQRSDIFAAGTVLWELLTNRRLFTGDNEFEIFQKVRTAEAELPSAKNPQVPPEVDRIVMKALTADPNDRYDWCVELARDLGQFLTSIEPLYTQQHLADWMARFFDEELASETAKIQEFGQIQTAQDIRRLYFGEGAQAVASPSPEAAQAPEDPTQIWDVDEAPGESEDIEAFAAQHTTVQAGGFELNDFLMLGEDELIEVHEEPGAHAQTMELDRVDPAMLRQSVAATQERRDAQSATLDRGGTNPGTAFTPEALAQAKKRRNMRAALAGVAVMVCLGLMCATLLVYLLRANTPPPEPEELPEQVVAAKSPGTIIVVAQPEDAIQVFVDGELRGEQSPLKLEGLEPGEYTVEIKREGYSDFSRRVSVGEGGLVPVEATLSPE